jgi:hypothetical protein
MIEDFRLTISKQDLSDIAISIVNLQAAAVNEVISSVSLCLCGE